ncbi:hypothetical protein GQ568_01700 [Patescibacteria group bacterium]|nr:hypothetical protein [Patescibacteria group bacterium]
MRKIIFVLLLFIMLPANALAWDDCPRNEINCPHPGDCNKYVDTDNDKICDRSQLAPEDRIEEINSTQIIKKSENDLIISNKQPAMIYHLAPISIFLIVLYFITHILSNKKIISIASHRKIWNILLLVSFLISGIFGILLVIEINFGTKFSLPFNMLFWHVEIGIAMFAISIFHIFWHWTYFKNMIRINR